MNTGRVVAGRTIVLYTSALHVLLGITLVISEPQLWVSAIGEAGLAVAVILAVIIGDRRVASGCRGRGAGEDGYASPARSVSTVFSVSRVAASPWCTSSKLVERGDRPMRRPPGSR